MDMLIYRDGVTHSGEAGTLESYHCWGEPILSPGAGTVVTVTNDLPDNPIGRTDPQHPAGNHVVIDLGNSEFAFLAHMQEGSITVSEGETVETGDKLGLCGNSGNTSEPHLHMHLQTTPDLTRGEGLPAQFVDYVANGEAVARGEPQAGQFIRAE
jgi:murein DD-endopeptidase MepM/ murein hydrolase activator NlpD